MKLHLPVLLRKALLACFVFSFTCTVSSAADLTLGSEVSLTIDYADAGTIPNLENGVLQLSGDTILLLSNCGEGDGKTYTLATGVSSLVDAEGNPLTLTDENNAIASYFDTTQPGTGFWAESTLVLTPDGSLQLVRHNETVKAAQDITTRQTSTLVYNDYEGISFKDIEYVVSDSDVRGGAIYGASSTITLSNNGSVSFSGNSAKATGSFSDAYGGAIYGDHDSTITLNNNGSVEFIGNDVICGGIQLYENLDVPNHWCGGGAIFGSTIELSNNGSVSFCENSAIGDASSGSTGGAISGITITLSKNDNVSFIGNSATSGYASSGGAIFGDIITLSNNGNVIFSENTAHSGGAIAGFGGSIKLSNNSSVTFSGNSTASGASFAPPSGSAIYGYNCTITLSKNDSVTFRENSGSVIYATAYSTITLSNNGSVAFSENSGRVIYSDDHTSITLSNNGSVTFRGNSGDVICGSGLIELNNNDKVVFSGNSGSAIYGYSTGCSIMLRDNGSVTFSGNFGNNVISGAIRTSGDNLSIRNNDSVLFEKNAEVRNGDYRLRSIYDNSHAGESGSISLSAAEGKSIEFRDSVYIATNSTVELNADYTDAAEVTHKQTGDIIFTGKYTEQHLNEILTADEQNRAATAEEILNSRTTVVNAMTNLYGGRLRVEDGAIYKGRGITVHEDSGATVLVKDATLDHAGYNLTFNAGTTLAAAGVSTISADTLTMESGSAWTFAVSTANAEDAVLSYSGNLTLGGALTLTLTTDGELTEGASYKLLSGVTQPINWSETDVTVTSGTAGWTVDFSDLTWEGDTLWICYDGSIVEPMPEPEPDPLPEFAPNLDRNQQVVYDTIKDIMGEGNPGGLLGELGKEIVNSRDEAALKRALDEVSGREYATIMSSQMEGNLGHLRRLRAAAGAGTPLGEYVSVSYCSYSNKGVDKSDNKGAGVMIAPSPVIDSRRLRAGISVFYEQGELDADGNGDGFDRSETGAQLTMEYLVSHEFIMGMGISQSRTRLTPDYGKTRHEDNTHFDLYGVYQSGRWSSTTVLGVGLHQHDLGRTVAGMQTDAEADGFSVNFLQEVACTVWADEQQGLQVFGAVESSFNKVDSFTETGAGNASLSMDSQEAWATDVTLGLRYNHALPALDKALPGTLSLHAGVVASLGDVEESATMRFAGAPGYSFRQEAAERNRWGYSVGVSVNLPVSANVAAFGSAEAVLRGDSYTADAQLGLKVAF